MGRWLTYVITADRRIESLELFYVGNYMRHGLDLEGAADRICPIGAGELLAQAAKEHRQLFCQPKVKLQHRAVASEVEEASAD